MKECITHHNVCDCREAKIERLVKMMRRILNINFRDSAEAINKKYAEAREVVAEWSGEYE